MIDVPRVKAGVAPPDEVPVNPFADATEIPVTVPLPLLLNVVQSAVESSPRFVAEAVGKLNVCVVPVEVIPKSVPVVPVANV